MEKGAPIYQMIQIQSINRIFSIFQSYLHLAILRAKVSKL